MARLSPAEVSFYEEQGWVIPQYRLSADHVARLARALETLLRDNPRVRPEKLVSAHVEGDHRAGANGEGVNREGVGGHRDFLAIARDPGIVDMVSGVIGDDVILWGCHVFCKPAGTGYATPWHQDGHDWPIRPLANCTVWVALEPSTVANGCLRVIPGSHRAQQLHPHLHEDRSDLTLNQRLADGSFDETTAVDLELQPGPMSLHDVDMIHGAAANTSALRRTGVALRYMPATSVFERDLRPVDGMSPRGRPKGEYRSAQHEGAPLSGVPVDFARRPLWLVKGVDRSGRNDLRTGHPA
jgi:hypothetical protein